MNLLEVFASLGFKQCEPPSDCQLSQKVAEYWICYNSPVLYIVKDNKAVCQLSDVAGFEYLVHIVYLLNQEQVKSGGEEKVEFKPISELAKESKSAEMSSKTSGEIEIPEKAIKFLQRALNMKRCVGIAILALKKRQINIAVPVFRYEKEGHKWLSIPIQNIVEKGIYEVLPFDESLNNVVLYISNGKVVVARARIEKSVSKMGREYLNIREIEEVIKEIPIETREDQTSPEDELGQF